MKATILIEEDAELRSNLRDHLKGLLNGVARDELHTMFLAALGTEGAKKLEPGRVEKLLQTEIEKVVGEASHQDRWRKDYKKIYTEINQAIVAWIEAHPEIILTSLEKFLASYTEEALNAKIKASVKKASEDLLSKLSKIG